MKKKVLVCSVAALAILLACSVGLTKDKAQNKEQKKKMAEQQKAWQEKLKAMTPEQRRIAIAKKAFDADAAPWREVRKIALAEKATKTVAAIDKIIAAKEEQLKKKLAAPEKRKRDAQKEGEGKRQGKREGKGKKAGTDKK